MKQKYYRLIFKGRGEQEDTIQAQAETMATQRETISQLKQGVMDALSAKELITAGLGKLP